jgi:hypothetical protein
VPRTSTEVHRNYIEGTTFTVEEAEDIVFHGQIIENRSEDSHDVLGTFNAAAFAPWRDQPPRTADDFLFWLRSVNALVMQKRADKKPGEWKDKPNQAGSTFFVVPELVPGTLREGFSRIEALVRRFRVCAAQVRRARSTWPLQRLSGGSAELQVSVSIDERAMPTWNSADIGGPPWNGRGEELWSVPHLPCGSA